MSALTEWRCFSSNRQTLGCVCRLTNCQHPCRPRRSLAVADRLITLSSALSSSPDAQRAHAVTCFWPALRAVSREVDHCRDAEMDSSTTAWLQSAAALLARLFAALAVRQRTAPWETTRLAAEDERFLAAVVACRADIRLAQRLLKRAADGSAAVWAHTPSTEDLSAGPAAALAAADDARTLLDERAAAALTGFLIDEPQPASAGSDRHAELWLTLHAAVAQLQLQGALVLLAVPCKHAIRCKCASLWLRDGATCPMFRTVQPQHCSAHAVLTCVASMCRSSTLLLERAAGEVGYGKAADRGPAASRAASGRGREQAAATAVGADVAAGTATE